MKKYKILLVDDGKTLRMAGKNFLEEANFEVIMAENGLEALSKVVNDTPDLILMDVIMDKMDGYKTCTIIKSNSEYSNIPIIMVSSKDGPFDQIKGKQAGSEDYITKPYAKDELIKKVKHYLDID